MPYVFFAVPFSKHAWPNVAACWSPRMPAIGTFVSRPRLRPFPYTSDDERISGSIDMGIPISRAMPSSQSSVCTFMRRVREAFVTSVTCTPPFVAPVMCHKSHVSIVPKSRSPASAFSRAPSTWSRIHLTFGPAKYVVSGRPVTSLKRFTPSSPASSCTIREVRVSCHTIAL